MIDSNEQRDDESAFVGQLQRPGNAELRQVGGRHGRQMRIGADEPARIGDGEDDGEGERETSRVASRRPDDQAQRRQQGEEGRRQRERAAQIGVGFGDRAQRLRRIDPHRRRRGPAPADRRPRRRRAPKQTRADRPEPTTSPPSICCAAQRPARAAISDISWPFEGVGPGATRRSLEIATARGRPRSPRKTS